MKKINNISMLLHLLLLDDQSWFLILIWRITKSAKIFRIGSEII